MRRFSALILAVALAASSVLMICTAETGTTVTYDFFGEHAESAGFAHGNIVVTPDGAGAAEGYYLVYYTDGNGVLAGYDELAFAPITGKKVRIPVGDGLMIPLGATGIAVFESKTHFLDEPPAIETAVAVCEIPASKRLASLGTLQNSFGALSDTHMNYQPYDRGAFEKLAYAMDFFAREGMEYVVITGDATGDRGENPDLEAQYEKHLQILKDSDFDESKVYEGIGNHGNTPGDNSLLAQYLGGTDEEHPYENSPYFSVLKKGTDGQRDLLWIFTAQELNAPGETAKYDNFSEAQMDWIEGLLTTYGETGTDIFMSVHAPFLNYGAGDRKNGGYGGCIVFKQEYAQTMRLKALLSEYKNVVVLSGHTHVTFYDGVNYSDENGHFARTVHIGSSCQPCGYGATDTYARSTDGRHPVTPEYGSEGYTVELYEKYIVFTGYNFSTGKKIPKACLLMPVDVDAPLTEETVSSSESIAEQSDEPSAEESSSDRSDGLPIGGIAIGCAVVTAGIAAAVLVAKKKNNP